MNIVSLQCAKHVLEMAAALIASGIDPAADAVRAERVPAHAELLILTGTARMAGSTG